MQSSKDAVKQAGIIPKLRLAVKKENGGTESTGPHTVKLVSDKTVKGTDPQTGKERYEMVYYVEEDGEKKKYTCPLKDEQGELHYLVQRMAEFEEGDMVTMEYQRKGLKGFISVAKVGEQEDDDIPIIEDEDEQGSPEEGDEENLEDPEQERS